MRQVDECGQGLGGKSVVESLSLSEQFQRESILEEPGVFALFVRSQPGNPEPIKAEIREAGGVKREAIRLWD